MEILMLLVYSGLVWLIFFKFEWLPWNTKTQIATGMIPVVGLTVMILVLNIVAPSSSDVRIINYVVQVVPRVTGRVVEVAVEPNEPVSRGDVLFRIDPTPFELDVRVLEARIPELTARIISAESLSRQLEDELEVAVETRGAVVAQFDLARTRLEQTRELADAGAGSRFDFERAEATLRGLEAQDAAAAAAISRARERRSARTDEGELSEVAQAKAAMVQVEAQLEQAQWKLDQTTVYAPADGRVINLQLRVGSVAAALPMAPVMSFVEDEQWILAMFRQNELRKVQEGDEAEIALKTYPNRIIEARVESIIWASGTGQLPLGGTIPQTSQKGYVPEGRYAVRMSLHGEDTDLFLANGAQGFGAIYTSSLPILHLIRKVLLRVSTKMDWIIAKLH